MVGKFTYLVRNTKKVLTKKWVTKESKLLSNKSFSLTMMHLNYLEVSNKR